MEKENKRIVNKNKCHPELDSGSSTLVVSQGNSNNIRGRFQIKFGMTSLFNNNNAFTLIELLVVVLIIGILAAVAVPQYQKAVEKSRAMQTLTLVKSLSDALESYYLANNDMPSSFDELDVALPADWTGTTGIYTRNATDHKSNAYWGASIEKSSIIHALHMGRLEGNYAHAGFSYYLKFYDDTIPTHEVLCMEEKSKITEGKFCKELFKGTKTSHNGTLRLYHLP
ncbi:type IV pilin protein [Candidatus Avelusimicrobium caledoniensis]|uniref:type IV pilin protein n=1 Tax=Candidatus Avelusimicrobium caledoniensis TaxID=3416220 RepID=UPI003D0F37FB